MSLLSACWLDVVMSCFAAKKVFCERDERPAGRDAKTLNENISVDDQTMRVLRIWSRKIKLVVRINRHFHKKNASVVVTAGSKR